MEDKQLSVTEAANQLGISGRLIRLWIERGQIPAQKYGKTWVINEKDLANHPPVGEWQGTHNRRKPKAQ